jgi:hypothetical protein
MYCRSDRLPWWRLPPNALTWVALGVLVGVQWLAVSWGPLAALLATQPLSLVDWATAALAVTWPIIVLESVKVAGAHR